MTRLGRVSFATGVRDVFVNGVQALKAGEPTGATPGQFVKGPARLAGWRRLPQRRQGRLMQRRGR